MRHRRSVNFDAPAPQPHGLRRARTVATFHPLDDTPISPLFQHAAPEPAPEPAPAREDPFATPPRIPSPPAAEEAFEDAQEQREEEEEERERIFTFNPVAPPQEVMNREHDRPSIFNRVQQEEEKADEAIDRCVAILMEMGYGDSEEIDRLRVYAQMSGGDLEDALEMLEEEKRAWEGH